MKKAELEAAVQVFKEKTRSALQMMYDALNQGQQKQMIREKTVKALFDRYGVTYSE